MNFKEEIRSYLSGAPTEIHLVVVGKDPFPQGAAGIPFCKKTWEEQTKYTCSGGVVLASLGINIDPACAEQEFGSPRKLFEALRDEGILFLNASYEFIGKPIRKKNDERCLEEAYKINKPFLTKAKNVVLCGEASKSRWVFDSDVDLRRFETAIHPDRRNQNRLCTKEKWSHWWEKGKLAKKIFGVKCSFMLKKLDLSGS